MNQIIVTLNIVHRGKISYDMYQLRFFESNDYTTCEFIQTSSQICFINTLCMERRWIIDILKNHNGINFNSTLTAILTSLD